MSRPTNFDRPMQFTLRGLMGLTALVAVVCAAFKACTMPPGRAIPKDASIKAETAMLDSAFKAYKEKYGQYPPSDFSNLDNPNSPQYVEMADHLRHAFPKADVAKEIAVIRQVGIKTPAQALCFWLSGFSVDSEHPISGLLNNPSGLRLAPLIDFDRSRLRMPKGEKVPVYVPPYAASAPYVYFASREYSSQAPFDATQSKQGGTGIAAPYKTDGLTAHFMNSGSFQIISAGMDDDYGGGNGTFPSGKNYANGDYDNITNFSECLLGEAIPK